MHGNIPSGGFIERQFASSEMTELAKTNVILLDTTTLLSLLIITVFIVQVFSLTIKTNNIQTLVGGRRMGKRSSSDETKFHKHIKRRWKDEYSWRKSFNKRKSFVGEDNYNLGHYSNNLQSYYR